MQGSFVTTTVVVIVSVAMLIVVFMLIRAMVWWYFGIDEHLANQKRIISLLEQLATGQTPNQTQAQSAQPALSRNPLTGKTVKN